jgi:hypothetical protein
MDRQYAFFAQCLAALPLSAFSIALFTTPLPNSEPFFHLLPGLWVLQLSLKTQAPFDDAWLAGIVVGGILMPLPTFAERKFVLRQSLVNFARCYGEEDRDRY